MNDHEWQKVKAIFNSALERQPEGRSQYLAEACGEDRELRAQVERLISSYQTDFLEVSPGDEKTVAMPAAQYKLRPGNVIGHYEIVRILGVGGMGEVYLARDLILERSVAIKIVSAADVPGTYGKERLLREARSAAGLDHPNICSIYEVGEEKGVSFIVMQYIDGETLTTKLRSGNLTADEILRIAEQVAQALDMAHSRGIVHRDIKPDNIMLTRAGQVKVTDFGLAKPIEETSSSDDVTRRKLTESGMIVGTLAYMSPEQARGEKLDARSDIFSLGAVLYEMWAGRRPFEAESRADLLVAILTHDPLSIEGSSPELQNLISKMLAKNREERYPAMQYVLADLKRCHDVTFDRRISENATEPIDSAEPTAPETQGTIRFFTAGRWALFAGIAVITAAAILAMMFRDSTSTLTATNSSGRSPAYDLYMRARVKVISHNREEVEGAINLLEQAVAMDPNYAEAYAALAQGYSTKAFQFASESERKQLSEDADLAVEKALALNPNLPEGHFARGIVLWTHAKRFPNEMAIKSFKRAIALNPNIDEAHHWLGVVYFHVGLLDEARKEIDKALDINPNNSLARFRIGTIAIYQGNYEDALDVFKTIPGDISPSIVNRAAADALVHLGRLTEASALAEDYLKQFPQDEGGNVTSVKAVLLAKAGKKQQAEATIHRAIEIGQGYGHFHHTAYNIASAYAVMDMPDEAMKWLQNAADDGFPNYPYFEIDHNLDSLRGYQPFIDFMAKLKAQTEKFRTLANAN